jgi:hypothetical protein
MTRTTTTTGRRGRKAVLHALGVLAFFGLVFGLSAQDTTKKAGKEPEKIKPAVNAGKEPEKIKPAAAGDREPDVLADAPLNLRKAWKKGYTLPGNVSDLIKDGSTVPIVFHSAYQGKILGGTVYFVVLERVGTEGDTWGFGSEGFDASFVEGRNFEGAHSPVLDTRARFIYLYQIVNDRGIRPQPEDKPGKAKEAAFIKTVADVRKDLATYNEPTEVASFTLKLQVDPRYITSWGYFQGTGLINPGAVVPDRLLTETPPANPGEQKVALAISGFNSLVEPLPPNRMYKMRSPAFPLKELTPAVGVGSSQTGINPKSRYYTGLAARETDLVTAFKAQAGAKAENKVRQVVFNTQTDLINNMLASARAARTPDYVQLMYFGSPDQPDLANPAVPTTPEDELAWAVFRADWRNENIIKYGQHSVIFGFTTDLPPENQPIRLDDLSASQLDFGLRQFPASNEALANPANGNPGFNSELPAPLEVPGGLSPVSLIDLPGMTGGLLRGQAQGIAPAAFGTGTAPTPVPPPAGGGGAMLPGGTFGTVGGLSGGGGGFPGMGLGGIGFARPPIFGGGGGFGGSGNGNGNGQGTPGNGQGNGNGTGNGQGSGQGNGNVNINFNVSQANQQQQQQGQQQAQQQQQHQHQTGGSTPGNVVPAPASALLGLLGLPGLFFLWRRGKGEPAAA